jgi:hypothetical protein
MERKAIKFFAIALALIPFGFIIFSHTDAWPEFFARRTDTYTPQGPTIIFNDITPGDRTKPIEQFEGFAVRPVIAEPTYLLFQPRRHSKNIRVEIVARANSIEIGGRSGNGPESNYFVPTEKKVIDSTWSSWTATLPLDAMIVERTDARRIVFNADNTTLIRSVRIFYED